MLEFWLRAQNEGSVFSVNKNDHSGPGTENFIRIFTDEEKVFLMGQNGT
jgi:hypothetical protein